MTSVWPRVEQLLRSWGVAFDPWQQGFSAVALGCRTDGRYAATIGGVVVSIPRQVGKTFMVARLLVALAVLFPGLRVIWTSHHSRTTTNTFRAMQSLVRSKPLRGSLAPNGVRTANGEQEIRFKNGAIIMFGAREHGFGRGMDGVDIIVCDEAQILSLRALEDMVPSTNQAQHPHGALVFFIGTPPRPGDDGEAFAAKRAAAIEGRTSDQFYVELSADADAALDDRKQWAKANPSFPTRTPLASMLRMRENIPDDGSWRREALGVWDDRADEVVPSVVDPSRWAELVGAAPEGTPTFGVKFSPDGLTVALGSAVRPETGVVHVEGVAIRLVVDGLRWLVDFLKAHPALVVVDGKAGAGAFVSALHRERVPAVRVKRPTVDEVIAAHAGFVEAARTGEMSHLDDPVLADGVDVAVRRPIGTNGGWGITGRDGEDVTLVEAVILAHWGATSKRKAEPRAGKVVVLS